MTPTELATTLKEMYQSAPKGEAVVMIHLFVVKFAKQIREAKVSPQDVVKLAGISESYGVEVNKAINLAKFVTVKPDYQ